MDKIILIADIFIDLNLSSVDIYVYPVPLVWYVAPSTALYNKDLIVPYNTRL